MGNIYKRCEMEAYQRRYKQCINVMVIPIIDKKVEQISELIANGNTSDIIDNMKEGFKYESSGLQIMKNGFELGKEGIDKTINSFNNVGVDEIDEELLMETIRTTNNRITHVEELKNENINNPIYENQIYDSFLDYLTNFRNKQQEILDRFQIFVFENSHNCDAARECLEYAEKLSKDLHKQAFDKQAGYDYSGIDKTTFMKNYIDSYYKRIRPERIEYLKNIGYSQESIKEILKNNYDSMLNGEENDAMVEIFNGDYKKAFAHEFQNMSLIFLQNVTNYTITVNYDCTIRKEGDMKELQELMNGLTHLEGIGEDGSMDTTNMNYNSSIQYNNLKLIAAQTQLTIESMYTGIVNGEIEINDTTGEWYGSITNLNALFINAVYSLKDEQSLGIEFRNMKYLTDDGSYMMDYYTASGYLNDDGSGFIWEKSEANVVYDKQNMNKDNTEFKAALTEIRDARKNIIQSIVSEYLTGKTVNTTVNYTLAQFPAYKVTKYGYDLAKLIKDYSDTNQELDKRKEAIINEFFKKESGMFGRRANMYYISNGEDKTITSVDILSYGNAIGMRQLKEGGLISMDPLGKVKAGMDNFNSITKDNFVEIYLEDNKNDKDRKNISEKQANEYYEVAKQLINGGFDLNPIINGTADKSYIDAYGGAVDMINSTFNSGVSETYGEGVSSIYDNYIYNNYIDTYLE